MTTGVTSALVLLFLLGLLRASAALELSASSCPPGKRFDGKTGGCEVCPSRPAETDSEQEHLHYEDICEQNPSCGCSDSAAGSNATQPSHISVAPPKGVDNAAKASNKPKGETSVGGGGSGGSSSGGGIGGDIGVGGGSQGNTSNSDTESGSSGSHTLIIILLSIVAAVATIAPLVGHLVCYKLGMFNRNGHPYSGVSTDVERGDDNKAASVSVNDGIGGSNNSAVGGGSGGDGVGSGGDGGTSGDRGNSTSEGNSLEGGVPSRPLPAPPAPPSVSVDTAAVASQDERPTEDSGSPSAVAGSPLSDSPQSGVYPGDGGTYDSV